MADAGEWLTKAIQAVSTNPVDLEREVSKFVSDRPALTKRDISDHWGKRIVRLYASEGAVTALPSAVPGLGTAIQVAVEGGAITADLTFMLRCMGRMVGGIASIHENDIHEAYTRDYIHVLGLWCGVLVPAREAVKRVGTKVAVAQFNRKVSGEVLARINRKVGTTILTKYGTKRSGIALGRLIPFGVGAVVGGGFNWATMAGFKQSAIRYYCEGVEIEEA